MMLRPYQSVVVKKAESALKKHGNTLVVGATGMGKTICLSALAGRIPGKTLVLQHRQELIAQNMSKFLKLNPGWKVSVFDANTKSWRGDAVFSMQQTLCRHTDSMPSFDHLITDEVHHIVSPTYRRIIDAAREKNPKVLLSGFTATPERSDRKSLRTYFNNVAERITIRELVSLGFLVPPKAFVVDCGVRKELESIKTPSAFGDQHEVAAVLNTIPINEAIIKHWREKADNRQTIVFCSTVAHANDVTKAFVAAGIKAEMVTGETPDGERRGLLKRFNVGETRVVVNVAVLTEGYDSPTCSCIVLLRQCSDKSPLIQMAGRGLRTVDPELHPGVVKKDCVILDFGTSILTHGNLDSADGLHGPLAEKDKKEAPTKICPEKYKIGMSCRFPDTTGNTGCGAEIPSRCKTCPICGFVFESINGEASLQPVDVSMLEMDILDKSPFRWLSLFGSESALMATGFAAWAGVFSPDGGETWHALGKLTGERQVHRLAVSGRVQAMAASDDFLREYETEDASRKSRRWLSDPATEKQIGMLQNFGYDVKPDPLGRSTFTKYSASVHTQFEWNRRAIEKALGVG